MLNPPPPSSSPSSSTTKPQNPSVYSSNQISYLTQPSLNNYPLHNNNNNNYPSHPPNLSIALNDQINRIPVPHQQDFPLRPVLKAETTSPNLNFTSFDPMSPISSSESDSEMIDSLFLSASMGTPSPTGFYLSPENNPSPTFQKDQNIKKQFSKAPEHIQVLASHLEDIVEARGLTRPRSGSERSEAQKFLKLFETDYSLNLKAPKFTREGRSWPCRVKAAAMFLDLKPILIDADSVLEFPVDKRLPTYSFLWETGIFGRPESFKRSAREYKLLYENKEKDKKSQSSPDDAILILAKICSCTWKVLLSLTKDIRGQNNQNNSTSPSNSLIISSGNSTTSKIKSVGKIQDMRALKKRKMFPRNETQTTIQNSSPMQTLQTSPQQFVFEYPGPTYTSPVNSPEHSKPSSPFLSQGTDHLLYSTTTTTTFDTNNSIPFSSQTNATQMAFQNMNQQTPISMQSQPNHISNTNAFPDFPIRKKSSLEVALTPSKPPTQSQHQVSDPVTTNQQFQTVHSTIPITPSFSVLYGGLGIQWGDIMVNLYPWKEDDLLPSERIQVYLSRYGWRPYLKRLRLEFHTPEKKELNDCVSILPSIFSNVEPMAACQVESNEHFYNVFDVYFQSYLPNPLPDFKSSSLALKICPAADCWHCLGSDVDSLELEKKEKESEKGIESSINGYGSAEDYYDSEEEDVLDSNEQQQQQQQQQQESEESSEYQNLESQRFPFLQMRDQIQDNFLELCGLTEKTIIVLFDRFDDPHITINNYSVHKNTNPSSNDHKQTGEILASLFPENSKKALSSCLLKVGLRSTQSASLYDLFDSLQYFHQYALRRSDINFIYLIPFSWPLELLSPKTPSDLHHSSEIKSRTNFYNLLHPFQNTPIDQRPSPSHVSNLSLNHYYYYLLDNIVHTKNTLIVCPTGNENKELLKEIVRFPCCSPGVLTAGLKRNGMFSGNFAPFVNYYHNVFSNEKTVTEIQDLENHVSQKSKSPSPQTPPKNNHFSQSKENQYSRRMYSHLNLVDSSQFSLPSHHSTCYSSLILSLSVFNFWNKNLHLSSSQVYLEFSSPQDLRTSSNLSTSVPSLKVENTEEKVFSKSAPSSLNLSPQQIKNFSFSTNSSNLKTNSSPQTTPTSSPTQSYSDISLTSSSDSFTSQPGYLTLSSSSQDPRDDIRSVTSSMNSLSLTSSLPRPILPLSTSSVSSSVRSSTASTSSTIEPVPITKSQSATTCQSHDSINGNAFILLGDIPKSDLDFSFTKKGEGIVGFSQKRLFRGFGDKLFYSEGELTPLRGFFEFSRITQVQEAKPNVVSLEFEKEKRIVLKGSEYEIGLFKNKIIDKIKASQTDAFSHLSDLRASLSRETHVTNLIVSVCNQTSSNLTVDLRYISMLWSRMKGRDSPYLLPNERAGFALYSDKPLTTSTLEFYVSSPSTHSSKVANQSTRIRSSSMSSPNISSSSSEKVFQYWLELADLHERQPKINFSSAATSNNLQEKKPRMVGQFECFRILRKQDEQWFYEFNLSIVPQVSEY